MKQFKGTIADKRLSDFNQYDNSLTKVKDRIGFVEGFLYNGDFVHDFFSTYFAQYYAVSPSQDGYLAEQDAVCKLLEILGTYILSANDVESNRKIEYKFWKSEKEYRDYKESNQSSLVSTTEDGKEVEVIDMFVDKKNDKNQKVVKSIEVTKKDIKEIKELRQLEDAIDYLKSPKGLKDIKAHAERLLEDGVGSEDEILRLKYIAKNTERYINKYAKALRESQLVIKKAIKRPIEFKNVLKDEGVANKLDSADFDNENVVKELVKSLSREDLTTDFGILIFDLNRLIKNIRFKEFDQKIINLFKEGYSQTEVCDELGLERYQVSRSLKRISKAIVEYYINQKIAF